MCNFFQTTLCHLLLRFFSQSCGKSIEGWNDDEKAGSHWNVLFLISSNILNDDVEEEEHRSHIGM